MPPYRPPSRRTAPRVAAHAAPPAPRRVLVVDLGGTAAKMRVAGTSETRRVATGPAMTPGRLVRTVLRRCEDWKFDAVSLGYPGPVRGGRPASEPWNLGRGWVRFDYSQAFGRPVRIVNDAAMQALGAYDGGRMLFLGLGTGLGTAMVVDGVLAPMELAHLPWRRGRSYEDQVGAAGLARLGPAAWTRAVFEMVATLAGVLMPDDIVIGGGNAHRLTTLPRGARRGTNDDAFAGGLALWNDKEGVCSARPGSR